MIWLFACADDAAVPDGSGWTPEQVDLLSRLRLDPTPRPDPTNRVADDPAAAALGQALFYDPGLSPAGFACSQCHEPDRLFSDGRVLGQGVGETGRHVPGLVGVQRGEWFFWDGRADSLWSQALGPIENPAEMGSDRVFVAHRVADAHRDGWERVFGPMPALDDLPPSAMPDGPEEAVAAWGALTDDQRARAEAVTVGALKAIEAFERRLVPRDSRFDRYVDAVVAGDPDGGGQLTPDELRGLELFVGDAHCTRCHNGPYLTDHAFHNLGVPEPRSYDAGRQVGASTVLGSAMSCRGAHSDTKDCPELLYLNPTFPDFQAAFKTPSLRYVAETAPYMHDGVFADLDAVLDFYSELPGNPPAGHRELTLRPLALTPSQKADLAAFLGSLTGDPLDPALLGPAESPGPPR